MKENHKPDCVNDKTRSGLNDPLARTVFNSLTAHIAILDHNGVILATNRAWQQFASKNDMTDDIDSVGYNYISICEVSTGEDAVYGLKAAEGIKSVLKGDQDEFLLDYPCHSATEKHWFYMRVIRLIDPDSVMAIVSHEEITALKLAEESLRINEKKLTDQKQELEEKNIALKVLLKQREQDRSDLEQKVLNNIKELVFPYIERMKTSQLRKDQQSNLAIIESHLKDIISPFLKQISSLSTILTPQELQIATLIKNGKASKEIADILNVSISTVSFHRKNLRNKLGLSNQNVNLQSYLLSMS